MKTLLDINVTPLAGAPLREMGHDPTHAREIDMDGRPDTDLCDWAITNQAAIVTFDADYVTFVATKRLTLPSMVHVRLRRSAPAMLIESLVEAFRTWSQALSAGAIVTIRHGRIACRRLPIVTNIDIE